MPLKFFLNTEFLYYPIYSLFECQFLGFLLPFSSFILSSSSFDRAYYVGTYGDLVVQTRYSDKIVNLLDQFFKKSKTLKDLDLIKLSEIVNKKIPVKLTVIKNLEMAKQINKSIISQIE